MSRARVLVLGPTPPPYHGVATFTRDLLAARSEDFELIHLDTSDRRDAGNLGRWDPRNIELGFANLGELALRGLRRRPELVYIPISQNAPAFLRDALFALQASVLGARVVIHLHGGYFRTLYDESGPAFRSVADRVLKAAAAVVVLGENLRGIFTGLTPDERIHVVENGVPDPGVWEIRKPRTASEFPVVTFMSTLTPDKGVVELLRAGALLKARYPNLEIRIAGGFPDEATEAQVRAQMAQHGVTPEAVRHRFVGSVTGAEKTAFFAGADVFCLPTRYRYEGQPLVILEALAAGLPVVSTEHAAIPNTIETGRTGVLTAANPLPEQIAAALDEVLSDAAKLDTMARACRETYARKYTLHACHERLFDVFRAALRV